MKQGIVILALGHPYYGRMAYNLALSLKSVSPDIPIALLHNSGSLAHLDSERALIFDHKIEIVDPKYWTTSDNKVNYAYTKLFLPELSPFDSTIFLDADTVWCSKLPVEDLFKQVEKTQLVIKNRNYYDFKTGNTNDGKPFVYWAEIEAVSKFHDMQKGRLYALHAEFMFFKKSDSVIEVFECAKEIANSCPVKSSTQWADQENKDELPLSLALLKKNMNVKPGFNPIHWGLYDSYSRTRTDVINSFYLLSGGGNAIPRMFKSFYNDLVQSAAIKIKMPQGFQYRDKKTFLNERKSI